MSEMMFIFTVIFVAYVVYHVINEQKLMSKSSEARAIPEESKVVEEQPVSVPVVKNPKPATIKPTPIKKVTPTPVLQNTNQKGLRDPKSGEVATVYSNYRFTKRWIKDALVDEGLLDKVYKNNELDAASEAKIKAAIIKLEALEKYKP